MAILVDTNFIIAYLIKSDDNHKRAVKLFDSFKEGELGSLYIADYIIDEVVTVLWMRLKRKDIVEKSYEFMSEKTGIFKHLQLSKSTVENSWEIWKKYSEYPKRPLSFTDCSLLAVADEYSIQYLVSFDAEFNGLLSVLS